MTDSSTGQDRNGQDHTTPIEAAANLPEGRPRRALNWLLLLIFFALPAAGALLTLVELVQDGVGGVDGLEGASGVAVSPDGAHVYATGGLEDALVALTRDVTNDTLTFLQVLRQNVDGVFGLEEPSSVAVSPDGVHVYVTARRSDTLLVFRRDVTNDTLTFLNLAIGGANGLDGAERATVSPDGRVVLVASSVSNAVAAFNRSPDNNAIPLLDVEQDGFDGVEGLAGAVDVAVSPDGSNVYVAGRADNAITVFALDATGDGLTFLGLEQDGVDGIDGLGEISGVVVSPDGRHVYTTASLDDALQVFARDGDGLLTPVALYRDGIGGIDGLAGAEAVAISPEGNLVFVASFVDSAVSVFHRDAFTGRLRQAEVLRDGLDGIDGLAGAIALATSPDALHVYVAAEIDDAVNSFRIVQTLFYDDFESGDTVSWSNTIP